MNCAVFARYDHRVWLSTQNRSWISEQRGEKGRKQYIIIVKPVFCCCCFLFCPDSTVDSFREEYSTVLDTPWNMLSEELFKCIMEFMVYTQLNRQSVSLFVLTNMWTSSPQLYAAGDWTLESRPVNCSRQMFQKWALPLPNNTGSRYQLSVDLSLE